MNLGTLLGQLRGLSILEGISCILLYLITMPIKYIFDLGMPNKIVGMIHGILFLAYILWVLLTARQKKWGSQLTIICFIASLLPFATFWVDAKWLKPLEQGEN